MSLYTLIIVTFIIFMAINVIIGLRGRKHASTTKEFLTASGQSGIWFVIASAVGASIGSGVVIGTTQYAVKLGVAGAWYAIACGLACIVFALMVEWARVMKDAGTRENGSRSSRVRSHRPTGAEGAFAAKDRCSGGLHTAV